MTWAVAASEGRVSAVWMGLSTAWSQPGKRSSCSGVVSAELGRPVGSGVMPREAAGCRQVINSGSVLLNPETEPLKCQKINIWTVASISEDELFFEDVSVWRPCSDIVTFSEGQFCSSNYVYSTILPSGNRFYALQCIFCMSFCCVLSGVLSSNYNWFKLTA